MRPDAIVHFAEQRAAPYSMKSSRHKRYTVDNNVNATHNLLAALVEAELDAHVVHLGTMGVYGYKSAGATIPEGYLNVRVEGPDGDDVEREILYPADPGSVYHTTKTLDQLLFAFYAKNDELRITDLHQGIVWGTQTDQTSRDERLINRFDYDGDYGTVLNRFLMEAAIGYPLTVHGTGGQSRAFIHIRDTVRCIELAIANPPERGDRVQIFNQTTEVHRVIDLAELVARLTGAEIDLVENPRKEATENELVVDNERLVGLGLRPTTLEDDAPARRSAGRGPLHRPDRPQPDPVHVAVDARRRAHRSGRSGADALGPCAPTSPTSARCAPCGCCSGQRLRLGNSTPQVKNGLTNW